jgi:hypothetical protein
VLEQISLRNRTANITTKAFFRPSASFVLGDGASFFFWIDPWAHGKCVGEFAPELLAAVSPRLRRQRTVTQALPNNAWKNDLTGPLTVPVLVQFLQLHQHLQHFQLADRVLWRWSSTGQYSSASAYTALQLGQVRIEGCAQLSKTRALNCCRFFMWLTRALNCCCFFMWLAPMGRCWTSERRQRHGLQDDSTCAL